MFERMAETARHSVTVSADEAARRGDRRIGTDHLLLGILHDPDAAKALDVTLEQARAELEALDQQALASVGIRLGDHAVGRADTGRMGRRPFTSGARAIIARSLALTVAQRSRTIKTKHMLLALLELEQPDPAAGLLAGLAIDRPAVLAKVSAL